jgi:hypothetical protein
MQRVWAVSVRKIFVWKLGRKRRVGRSRLRWEDNIKMVTEIECECVDLSQATQDMDRCLAVVNTRMSIRAL